jgi:hypothetical protein
MLSTSTLHCCEQECSEGLQTADLLSFGLAENPPAPATHSGLLRDFFQGPRMGRKSWLFAHSHLSPDPRFAELKEEIGKSLRPYPRIFPFCRDNRWMCPGRSPNPHRAESGVVHLDCRARRYQHVESVSQAIYFARRRMFLRGYLWIQVQESRCHAARSGACKNSTGRSLDRSR